MDAIRFSNFLHDFAANSAQKTSAKATDDGKTSAPDLADTFTTFESQLKALMSTSASSAPAPTTAPANGDEFVIGGGSQSSADLDKSLAATEAMLAIVSEKNVAPQTSTSSASSSPAAPDQDDLKEIIAWRREKMDPLLYVRVGDIWDRQGITDPFNHPKLLADAQHSQEVSLFRKAHMLGFVAQWEGDWRTALAAERQADKARQIELAAASAANGFITGGGSA